MVCCYMYRARGVVERSCGDTELGEGLDKKSTSTESVERTCTRSRGRCEKSIHNQATVRALVGLMMAAREEHVEARQQVMR